MSKRTKFLKLLSILFLIFLFAASVNAAVYYVDQNHPQASDENPGTEELPWKTLKKACNTAQAGDTIIVKKEFILTQSKVIIPTHLILLIQVLLIIP